MPTLRDLFLYDEGGFRADLATTRRGVPLDPESMARSAQVVPLTLFRDGANVGGCNRTFLSDIAVHHSDLRISATGRGNGEGHFRHQMLTYQSVGVRFVAFSTAEQGHWFWARPGVAFGRFEEGELRDEKAEWVAWASRLDGPSVRRRWEEAARVGCLTPIETALAIDRISELCLASTPPRPSDLYWVSPVAHGGKRDGLAGRILFDEVGKWNGVAIVDEVVSHFQ